MAQHGMDVINTAAKIHGREHAISMVKAILSVARDSMFSFMENIPEVQKVPSIIRMPILAGVRKATASAIDMLEALIISQID